MTDGSGWDVEDHPLSASKLKTFDRCPKQFELKYIDGVDAAGTDTTYLDIGNAVHYTIEEELAGRLQAGDNSVTGVDAQMLKSAFLAKLPDVVIGHMVNATPDPRQQFPIELDDDQRETVVDCLDTAARWLADRQPRVRGVEDEADFRISRPDLDVPVTGYMDLTTGGPDDPNEVVDWKTGKSEDKDMDEALQGATYMAGYYNLYDETPDAIHYVYLKEGKVRTLDPDDDLWQTLLGKARTLMAAAEAGEFPAQPSDSKCHWCDYEIACSASPVGAGGIDWESYPGNGLPFSSTADTANQ